MRPRPAFYIVLLVVVSAGAALISRRREVREAPRTYAGVPVVVVSTKLPAGAVLGDADLSQRTVKEETTDRSNVFPDRASELIGKRLNIELAVGEPIHWRDVNAKAGLGPVQARARAVTIDVEPHRAVDGRLDAGDHVDVLVTLKDPQTDELVTRTLVQNVILLGVTHRAAPEPESLTLLVIEEEAELLLLSQDLGRFAISLRHPDDLEANEGFGRATINTLMSRDRLRMLQLGRARLGQ